MSFIGTGIWVCAANRFLRSPDGEELLAVGLSTNCITGTNTRSPSSNDPEPLSTTVSNTPLFTNIKIQLGILHAEIEDTRGQ
jgi:hypothetical protein